MIVHLGDESIETYFVAEYLLDRGYTVTVVGHGDSMKGIIADGTRMILKPAKDKHIAIGEAVFCRAGEWGYQVHKVANIFHLEHGGVRDRLYRIETADGGWCGNVSRERIYAKYAGAWEGAI